MRNEFQFYKIITNLFCRLLLPLLKFVPFVDTQQSYCWEPCSFNCPKAGPRLCPPESILTYFDCCPGQGCCQYIKWPNLIFLIIIIIMIISGCACCFCFLFNDARQRMFARQNLRQQEGEVATGTTANPAAMQRMGSETRVSNMNNQQTMRNNIPICHETICTKSRSSSTPSSGIVYHKHSTIV